MGSNFFIRNYKYLNPFLRKIGYIGWLGFGNLGDEALYLAITKLFSKNILVPYKFTKKINTYEKITQRKMYDGIILGGGTLINAPSCLEVLEEGYENYNNFIIFGSGVRNPEYWDREKKGCKDMLKRWAALLSKSKFNGVRGPLSKKILNDYGVQNVEIIGDPVLFYALDKIAPKSENHKIGLNIGVTNNELWGDEESILNFVINLGKVLVSQGWSIEFLPVSAYDIPYIAEAAKKIGGNTSIFTNFTDIDEVLKFFDTCTLFIGEKLHSVIFAICANTPSIMLEYRPKCLDFMMSMGLEEFNVRTNELSIDRILYLIEKLLVNMGSYQQQINSRALYYKNILKMKSNELGNPLFTKLRSEAL